MAHFGEQLSGLTAFVRSVELGSFSEAARALKTSPSAVSKAVAKLEDRSGVLLLRRTTRSLQLTSEGDMLYERGRHIIEELEAAENELREAKGPRGRLRITAPIDLGKHWLVPLVPMFATKYPRVRLELDLSDRILELDRFDLAIRLGERATPDTVRKRLGPTTATICAAPLYLKKHGSPRTPRDLTKHNCLHYLRESGQTWPIGDDTINVQGTIAISNNDALLTMALGGLGIVRIPDFIAAQHIKAGHLKQLFSTLATPSLTAYVLYPERRHLALRVRAFVDFVAAAFPCPSKQLRSSALFVIHSRGYAKVSVFQLLVAHISPGGVCCSDASTCGSAGHRRQRQGLHVRLAQEPGQSSGRERLRAGPDRASRIAAEPHLRSVPRHPLSLRPSHLEEKKVCRFTCSSSTWASSTKSRSSCMW